MIEALKYPIGKFQMPENITPEMISDFIRIISDFPEKLKNETINLSDNQLNTLYRPEGWSLRQVVHHCADSHMNAFLRMKLALTELNPVIKPYHEGLWAELDDSKLMPISSSISIIEGIHQRWVRLLQNLSTEDVAKTYFHPENNKNIRIDTTIAIYAWHCQHHLAHITTTKKSNDWN